MDPQLLKAMREEIRMVAKEALGEAIRDDLKWLIKEEVAPVLNAVEEVRADVVQVKQETQAEIASLKLNQQALTDKISGMSSASTAIPTSKPPAMPSSLSARRPFAAQDQSSFQSYVHVKGWAPYGAQQKAYLTQEKCLELYQRLRAQLPQHVKPLCQGVIANRVENYEFRIKAANRDTCFTIKDALSQVLNNHADQYVVEGRPLKCNVTPTPGKRLRDQQFASRLEAIHRQVPHAKVNENGPLEVIPCWASGKLYLQKRGDDSTRILAGTPTRGGAWMWETDLIKRLLPDIDCEALLAE